MNKHFKNLFITASFFFIHNALIAQGYFGNPLEGEISGSLKTKNCYASSITVKYRLSSLVGEPTVFLNFKWQAGNGTSKDCLSNESYEVYLKIQPHNSGLIYYLPMKGALGLIPKGDNSWGYNPISGSPDWDELIMITQPSKINNDGIKYLSKENAKATWKNGLSIIAVIFLDTDGNENYIKN